MKGNANQSSEFDELASLDEREAGEEEARLAQAKKEAEANGKEPFDLDRLEQLYATSPDLGKPPERDERARVWEWKYYVQAADLLTLAEFAERQRKLDPYR